MISTCDTIVSTVLLSDVVFTYSAKDPMVKKRRKLNKEMEREISIILQKIELNTALINDIEEDELLSEYLQAFTPIKVTALTLDSEYKLHGITDLAEKLMAQYSEQINIFNKEYEL